MAGLTVDAARVLLRDQLAGELAEERERPPCWAPFTAHHAVLEVRAADAARRTRIEHIERLADAPAHVLAHMLAGGWDPRFRQ